MLLASCGRERGFERVEYNFLVDAFLVGDRIDGQQNFFVHNIKDSYSLRPQSRLLNPIERQAMRLAVDFHYNRVAHHRLQYPDKTPPSVHRQLKLSEYPLAQE